MNCQQTTKWHPCREYFSPSSTPPGAPFCSPTAEDLEESDGGDDGYESKGHGEPVTLEHLHETVAMVAVLAAVEHSEVTLLVVAPVFLVLLKLSERQGVRKVQLKVRTPASELGYGVVHSFAHENHLSSKIHQCAEIGVMRLKQTAPTSPRHSIMQKFYCWSKSLATVPRVAE